MCIVYFIDTRCPQSDSSDNTVDSFVERGGNEQNAIKLRALLGRRLVRNNRLDEAGNYFAGNDERQLVEGYRQNMLAGRAEQKYWFPVHCR